MTMTPQVIGAKAFRVPPTLSRTSKPLHRASALLLAAVAVSGCSWFGGSSPERGQTGFVSGFLGGAAAEEPRAALVAREVLSAGGSATDAAVAGAFALTATLPSRAGIGGGGACLVYERQPGTTQAILFEAGPRSTLPPNTDRPAAIPMMARGLFALHTRGGRLRFEELVRPAEDLARGNAVSRSLANDLAAVAAPLLADPQARAIFGAPGGGPLGEGAQLVQRDLAVTLTAIRTTGPGDLYQGSLARRLEETSRMAGGGLTVEELRAGQARLVAADALRIGNDTANFLPGGIDGGVQRAFQALQAGQPPATSGVGAGASTGLVTFDRDGNAVTCAFSMNNLFGTGRVAPGTGVVLAAAPGQGSVRAAPLSVMLIQNTNLRAFRLAVAGSGQDAAPIAAAATALRVLRGEAPQAAIPAAAPEPGRVVAASCPRYLPGAGSECTAAADPRGSGIAVGTALR
ncbi:gamma-glutamyltransferase [Plastoroseomonas hellenica]|nr:gamma-glutamyltransferase [Plastoroseomonas hellenica]